MNNVLLLGYFGYENNQIDGQTIKTRLVGEVLSEIEKINYDFFDTQKIKNNPIKSFFNILIKVLKAKKIFIMPGKNGLKIIFPFVYFICLLSFFNKKDINYIVVGGWLSEFLENNLFIKYLLKKIQGIYIESNLMKQMLSKQNITNVKVLYNFRKIEIFERSEIKDFKIVYFSRITETKGIFDLIDALEKNDNQILLDFYGPIDEKIKNNFLERIAKYPNIEYKGLLRKNMYQTLSQYKFMVFPTYYEGEGFPGAVIDAYIAGLPIIASNWKYNFEFVKDNKTGLLFEPRNIEELTRKINYLFINKDIIKKMKIEIDSEIQKYSFTNAKKIFNQIIINKEQ
jgi:glycosyltransferase involved in cell wall biosynthesis